MNKLSTILGIGIGAVLGGFVILFGIYNTVPAKVDFLVGSRELPLYAVAAIFFLAGAVVSAIGAAILTLRGRVKGRRLQRRLDELSEEVRRLRNAPITGSVETTGESSTTTTTRRPEV